MKNLNLLYDNWFEVYDRKTDKQKMVGFLEAFEEANDVALANWEFVNYPLIRIMESILYKVCADNNITRKEIIESKQLPFPQIKEYLESVQDRFNLFDSKHPFMQENLALENGGKFDTAKLIGDVMQSAHKLRVLVNRTDYTVDEAEAARWILFQNFFGDNANKKKINKAGKFTMPITAKSLNFFMTGFNLYETLMLNMNENFSANQTPSWENSSAILDLKEVQVTNESQLLSMKHKYNVLTHEGDTITGFRELNGEHPADEFSFKGIDDFFIYYRTTQDKDARLSLSTPNTVHFSTIDVLYYLLKDESNHFLDRAKSFNGYITLNFMQMIYGGMMCGIQNDIDLRVIVREEILESEDFRKLVNYLSMLGDKVSRILLDNHRENRIFSIKERMLYTFDSFCKGFVSYDVARKLIRDETFHSLEQMFMTRYDVLGEVYKTAREFY